MDALTATKAGVFVIDIKTIPAFFISQTNRGKSMNIFLLWGHPIAVNQRINHHKPPRHQKGPCETLK